MFSAPRESFNNNILMVELKYLLYMHSLGPYSIFCIIGQLPETLLRAGLTGIGNQCGLQDKLEMGVV